MAMRGIITSHAPYQARYMDDGDNDSQYCKDLDWCDQFDADDNEMITGDGYEQERSELFKPC